MSLINFMILLDLAPIFESLLALVSFAKLIATATFALSLIKF
jgi:hypothetical protein